MADFTTQLRRFVASFGHKFGEVVYHLSKVMIVTLFKVIT